MLAHTCDPPDRERARTLEELVSQERSDTEQIDIEHTHDELRTSLNWHVDPAQNLIQLMLQRDMILDNASREQRIESRDYKEIHLPWYEVRWGSAACSLRRSRPIKDVRVS